MTAARDPVVIVGLACRFPGAPDSAAFWKLLRDGGDAIGRVPASRWTEDAGCDQGGFIDDVDMFDAAFFGISAREAEAMDPQQRIALEVATTALEHAGLDRAALNDTRVGVYMGVAFNDYATRAFTNPDNFSAFSPSGTELSMVPNRISHVYGLRGPSLAVNTGCSSALVAVHLACRSILAGESDRAIAGGVSLMLSPHATTALSHAWMLAADGRCKAFDARADGYVRGEGCGVVVLERLSTALREGHRVLAVIGATAVNHSGTGEGLTAPNRAAQAAVMREALAAAGREPGEVSFVEAHGVGTRLGDATEVAALRDVLGDSGRPCYIGAVKTNIGHLEWASGAASLIKTVLAVERRTVPANLHLQTVSPHIALGERFVLPRSAVPVAIEVAGVNGFGLGGTNAHIVIEAPPPAPIAFSFSGQGAQTIGMAAEMRAREPVFRAAFDRCAALFDMDLAAVIDTPHVHRTEYAQPALFTVAYAFIELFRARGIAPAAALGHSIGEYAAAYVAGALSLEDAVTLVRERGRLMGSLPEGGAMLSVVGDEETVRGYLTRVGDALDIAAVNGARNVVVSGEADAVAQLEALLEDDFVACQRLTVSHAFHSRRMEPILDAFERAAAAIRFAPLTVPVASNVTGALLPAGFVYTPAYWRSHLRGAVRFNDNVQALEGAGITGVVELSSADVLTKMGRRCSKTITFMTAAEWPTPLRPTRVFQRQRYWLDAKVAATSDLATFLESELKALTGATSVDRDRGLFELGLTSLGAIELQGRLERYMGRRVEAATLFAHPTINALVAHLQGASPARPQLMSFAPDEPIAIVGIGLRVPGASTPHDFWQLLRDGRDATREVPSGRWGAEALAHMYVRRGGFLDGIDQFDAAAFALSRREAESMDPQQRMVLEVASEALADSGRDYTAMRGSNTGVFIGVISGEYAGAPELADVDAFHVVGNICSAAAGRVSYHLGLAGPSLVVDTACSSSLVAMHLACQSLRNGECDTALAGGVSLMLSPAGTIALCKAQALAPDGRCKTFAANADGYARAEGCGVVVLRPLSRALADGDRVLAIVRGSAVNHDGQSAGFTAPNGASQVAVVRQALAKAGIAAGDIDYVEAHGTGTPIGDPIEVSALAEVFAESQVRVGSVKANVGHLEAAAGVIGIIKTVLALTHEAVPPQLHVGELNPMVVRSCVRISGQLSGWMRSARPRRAGVSAFGMSGTNAHLVLEEGQGGGRASLPRPQWKHERFWKSAPAPSHVVSIADEPVAADNPLRWLYETTWQARPLQGSGSPKRIAVLGASELARSLGSSADLDTAEVVVDARALDERSEASAAALIALVQQLAELSGKRRLYVVTRSTGNLAHAALWGLGRVVQREHPELGCTLIDISELADIHAVRREIAAAARETQVTIRNGARHTPAIVPVALDEVSEVTTLTTLRPGFVDDVVAVGSTRRAPNAGEIEARVTYMPLSFLDAMRATALCARGPGALGHEWVGTVTRVGSGVTHLAPGDRAMGFALAGVGSYVTTSATLAVAISASATAEDAATIPLAFCVAHQALVELGRVQRGDRVLIHSATGAIGQACVQLAKRAGAEIIATAGDEARRAWLRDQGVEHVFDSRSLAFVKAPTPDIAISTVAGPAAQATCDMLGPFGRFIDLNRRGASPVTAGANVMATKLDVMSNPGRLSATLGAVAAMLARGDIRPLERTIVPAADAKRALRSIAQMHHRGKVVLRLEYADAPALIRDDRTYLITGGLGALGRHTATWLAACGARHIVLVSRGSPSVDAEQTLAELGPRVTVIAADIGKRSEVERLLARVRAELPPLAGVFHAAGVLDDAIIRHQSADHLAKAFAGKVEGARHLDTLVTEPLDHFVAFSSIAGAIGTPAQANYSAANACLDALIAARHARGLVGTSIQWGPWSDGGMAVSDIVARRAQLAGVKPMAPASAMALMKPLLASKRAHTMVLDAQWPKLATMFTGLADAFDLDAVSSGIDRFSDTTARPARDVAATIAKALRLDHLDTTVPLAKLGLDSLVAVELSSRLGIPVKELLRAPSVDDLLRGVTTKADAVSPFVCDAPRPEAKLRLICLPFAGGGPSLYRSWPASLPESIEVVAVQLAGRAARIDEVTKTSIGAIVDELVQSLPTDKPYAMFGHCMGALVMFEVARRLRESGRPGPVHLFVSASPGPNGYLVPALNPDTERYVDVRPSDTNRLIPVHALPSERFFEVLRFLGFADSRALTDDPELARAVLPMVMADFQACDDYQYTSQEPLTVPITAIGGVDDPFATEAALERWKGETSASFALSMRPGDHYYVVPDRAYVLGRVRDILARY